MAALTLQASDADPAVFQLSGQLTYDNAHASVAAGETLLKDHPQRLVLDFSDVDRVDTAGIAVILSWTRYAQKNKQSLVVQGLPEQALALIQNSGLSNLLPIV